MSNNETECGVDEAHPTSISLIDKCPIHGSPKTVSTDCNWCHGEGEIEDDDSFWNQPKFVRCWHCAGSGEGESECEICMMDI